MVHAMPPLARIAVLGAALPVACGVDSRERDSDGGAGAHETWGCPTMNAMKGSTRCGAFYCPDGAAGCVLCIATGPVSLPGCCLSSGECGADLGGSGPPTTYGSIVLSPGCNTYATLAALPVFIVGVPPDPHQACGPNIHDASLLTDSSADGPG
jgi:hypothetical protein